MDGILLACGIYVYLAGIIWLMDIARTVDDGKLKKQLKIVSFVPLINISLALTLTFITVITFLIKKGAKLCI